ncbi:MAG: hypothetical protein R2838_26560 [Caldilineaceae bacterium]
MSSRRPRREHATCGNSRKPQAASRFCRAPRRSGALRGPACGSALKAWLRAALSVPDAHTVAVVGGGRGALPWLIGLLT